MEIDDPALLTERAVKLQKIVASLPKIQRFVSEVCEIVLCHGADFIPYHLKPPSSKSTPSKLSPPTLSIPGTVHQEDVSVLVPSILKYWIHQFS